MSARLHSIVFTAVAGAGALCNGGASLPAQAEPMKPISTHASRHAGHAWKLPAPGFAAHGLKAPRAQVASATRKLDLSKLTMADFGDVDPSR